MKICNQSGEMESEELMRSNLKKTKKTKQIINRNQHLKSQLCLTFREHFYLQSQ